MTEKNINLLWPEEPARMTSRDAEALLLHCVKINASDITIQTDENIFVEVYGKLLRITKRRMTPSEINEIVSALYQSESGLAKLNGGHDLDFAYEIRPERLMVGRLSPPRRISTMPSTMSFSPL